MKNDSNPGKPAHVIHIRLGGSEMKLNARAARFLVVFGVVLIATLLGAKVDVTTVKAVVRLVL